MQSKSKEFELRMPCVQTLARLLESNTEPQSIADGNSTPETI
jgi:hypothetical protein